MILRRETTVWERFVKPGHRTGSHNHHFMADVSSWIVKNIAGIKVNPFCGDLDTVLIEPSFNPEISEVNAVVKTPNGKVCVKRSNKNSELSVGVETQGKVKILYPDKSNAKIRNLT